MDGDRQALRVSGDPDYIIIGAGSSGCVLANRLSGPTGGQVLLLEAGGGSRGLKFRVPLIATRLWFDPRCTWSLLSEPEPGLNGRRLPVPRGKVLGGSSAINGTVFNRGVPADYDHWRDTGLDGWDYASLLPHFRRIERHWRGADALHGTDGEVSVNPLNQRSLLTPYVLEAAQQMGFPITEDFIGPQSEGIGVSDLNVDRSGRRVSAADAFLWPIRTRQRLTVHTQAQVLRVLVENHKAVGVEYLQDGRRCIARAQREVILSGGAIASPQLLMLSGIGPAAALRSLGIAVIHDAPEVGANFNDQPGASFEIRSKLPLTLVRDLRIDRFALNAVRWALGRGGPLAGPPIVAAGAVRTQSNLLRPDLRVNVASATIQSKLWCPGFGTPPAHRLLFSFAVAHPASRGNITLASNDPRRAPLIRFNLLAEQSDLEDLRRYYRLMQELVRQPALACVAGELIRPARAPATDDELDAYLRSGAMTTSHPMGSCRMGADERAVVDSECRVRGVEGLRVVDASVFPSQISGNPHSTAMMIGDRIGSAML
jgi:choline dehydrogenase